MNYLKDVNYLETPLARLRRSFRSTSTFAVGLCLSLLGVTLLAACGGESTLNEGFTPPASDPTPNDPTPNEPLPPGVVSVRLEPDAADLVPGQTVQFQVVLTLEDGTETIASPSFFATGGQITADGWYTAGATSGTFVVEAMADGTEVRGLIAIQDGESPPPPPGPPPPGPPPPPPPPPPPGADIQLDFDSPNSLGVTCGGATCPFPGGTYRKHSYQATGGANGTGAINMHWQTGMSIGASPVWINTGYSNHFKLRYAVRQTAQMQHQGSAIKLLRISSGSNRIGTLESKQGQFVWFWDDWYEGAAVSAASIGASVFADGQWHIYEVELDYRNVGQLVAKFSFDGVLVRTLNRSATVNQVTSGLVISPFAEMYSCGPSGCGATINTGDYTVDDFSFTVLP